jgi:two-component system LytT family sensor kinase
MNKKILKFGIMILVGIGISFLLELLVPMPSGQPFFKLIAIFESILITIILWEGNLKFDRLIDKKISWEKNPALRIIVQLFGIFLLGISTLFIIMWLFNIYVCKVPIKNSPRFVLTVTIISILISILLLAVEIGFQFFKKWKKSLTEIEQYKSETALAKLENLKNQINPHFLFNNMSVLSSLVYKDQDKAVAFINQLSKVYRYLLDNGNNELVSIREELLFIESYSYLLNIRYSPNLMIEIAPFDEQLEQLIPPLALQLLIENAIKHNEISSDSPLKIELFTEGDYLVVRNNLKPRLSKDESSNTGLKNIKARYSYFSEKEVLVYETMKHFEVKIPILKAL